LPYDGLVAGSSSNVEDTAINPTPDSEIDGAREKNLAPIIIRILAWTVFALFVGSMGFQPLRSSHDEWWHLKSGKWMVENNGFRPPVHDVFTYTAAAYPWDNHEWASQIVMYLVWRWGEARDAGGWRSVIFLKCLVLLATYGLLARFVRLRSGPGYLGFAITFFLMVLAVSIGRRVFWPRPPVVSYFFMTVFLLTLWLHRSGRLATVWLLALPPVMAVWANLHGGFMIGGTVVGAYFGGELLECIGIKTFGKSRDLGPKWGRCRTYLVLGILCGVASLSNPYGYRLYLLPGRVMKCKALVRSLSELLPPDFRFTWAYALLLALVGVGILVLVARTLLKRSPKWPPLAELILVLFYAQQSLAHVRHLPLFGIAAVPVAGWFLWEWTSCLVSHSIRRIWTIVFAGSAFVGMLWVMFVPGEGPSFLNASRYAIGGYPEVLSEYMRMGTSPVERNRWLLEGRVYESGSYPDGAASFALRAKLPGRMFNRNNCSGYLIWALSPEHYRLFTDSRFDVFGQDFLMDELSIVRAVEIRNPGEEMHWGGADGPLLKDWREVVRHWNINWMLVGVEEDINARLLVPDSGWALLYADAGYAIWIRRVPENASWIERYENPEQIAFLKNRIEALRRTPGR
jgi:hypothetical protein